MYAHLYQQLSLMDRLEVDEEVDKRFRHKTGITTKLDWANQKDRPNARIWLRLRDVVIAKHLLMKKRRSRASSILHKEALIRAMAQQAKISAAVERVYITSTADRYQDSLADGAEGRGMPSVEKESGWGKFIEVVHAAASTFETAEPTELWVWLLGEHAAASASLGISGLVGPVFNLLGGLLAIGHANEAGQRGAERNSFKWGFAATIAAMANGRNDYETDWRPDLPLNTAWGRQQMRGRNAAIRMIKEMGRDVAMNFLQRYQGREGRARMLQDLGGYD
jgi:hypothetical protein